MIKQYPYTLQVRDNADGGFMDDNGDWVANPNEWETVCSCRDEAGNGKSVAKEDSTTYMYTALIQCPRIEAPAVGTEVRVLDGEAVRLTARVEYSRKDQLHTRIWV